MIKIDNLSFKYDEQYILKNLSLTINDGDFLAIVGENGSGKSTLVKCLIGINEVKHNTIKIDDVCISCFKQYNKIGYVKQANSESFSLPISGLEYLNLITKDQKKIAAIIEKLNLNLIVEKNYNDLSGGQRQRINIASALLNDIRYLILDEPTTGLDYDSRLQLYNLLNQLKELNITIILISHNLSELEIQPNRVFDMNKQSLFEEDNA